MMMCDCEDGATGDGRGASNSITGDAGDVDAIRGESFLLLLFDVGTEVGAGAGVGVGVAWGRQSPPSRNGRERLGRLSSEDM